MGYIVNIKYHPKNNDNTKFGFDTQVSKEKLFKIGKKEEEVSKTELASVVLKQLSRRDILVHDVEIYEFVKKQISVKETKNGIIIGNKKYTFDNNIMDYNEVEEITNNTTNNINQQLLQQTRQRNIIKSEYFIPETANNNRYLNQFKQMGLTPGKLYNIIEELPGGERYKIINDSGGVSVVSVMHFSAVKPSPDLTQASNEIKLSYPGQIYDEHMLNVRN